MKMDDERHKEEFKNVSENCPWRRGPYPDNGFGGGFCEATENKKPCLDINCAPFHFRKTFERRL
jgi:hypothetical protein